MSSRISVKPKAIKEPKIPKEPKKLKEPKEKKMKPSTYLNRFELLMNSHYAPLNIPLTPESIFYSASKSYSNYKGNYDDFLSDSNLSKFTIYHP